MAEQVTGLLSSYLRRRRFKAAIPHIRGKVLDFGCGTGELAAFFSPADYWGVDSDLGSLQLAWKKRPHYKFSQNVPDAGGFDTIVLLAVIEHVANPQNLLEELKTQLNPTGQLVMTTPHPSFGWVHALGAKIGIFSSEASEEHEDLWGLENMHLAAQKVGLRLKFYRRFLLGANQLFIFANRETGR
jgi:2-polyprenyl-3-methyl-5-hydroxy-6-metoxy-1,4-benzoquinol methylase